jgi:hypothetical protein
VRKYKGVLFLGPPIVNLNDDTYEAFRECFNSVVVDEKGTPVDFVELEETWPDELIPTFVKTILKLSD